MASKYIEIYSNKGGSIDIHKRNKLVVLGIDDIECEEYPQIFLNAEELEELIKILTKIKEEL